MSGVRSLTTLSPVERLSALRARLTFVSNVPGIGQPLLDLSFIHFARWAILESLPDADGSGKPWRLTWPQLLFDVSFDGSEDDYLNTFADLLPLRLAKLFGTCVGFQELVEQAPGAERRVIAPEAFREFVAENKLERLDFHVGGRPRSVNDIRQGHQIERVERRSNRLSGDALDRAQRRVEALALGPPPARTGWREGVIDPWLRRLCGGPAVQSFILAAPVLKGRTRALRALARPLAGIPQSHFARLALIPPRMKDLGQRFPDRLPVYYLLLTSDHDGAVEDYVEALRRRWSAPADLLFSHCAAYPGSASKHEFHDWFRRHRRDTRYYVAGYPARPLPEIEELARVRAGIKGRFAGRPA